MPTSCTGSWTTSTRPELFSFTTRAVWCKLGGVFVIELVYKAPLTDIDAHMAAHVRFLKKYYASGNFLVSGRKIPRDGGIILAVGKDRRFIETLIEEDPFFEHGLADFRIIEFRASQRADDIQKRIDSEKNASSRR
jgi:uncharacterized protein YciI